VIVSLPDGTQVSIPPIDCPFRYDERVQSWDCTFKDLDTSDYVVGQVWVRCGSAFMLGDQVRARMDCPATVHAVRQMSPNGPTALRS